MKALSTISSILLVVLCVLKLFDLAAAVAPASSVLVFEKGEGGYYCHKIPYLLLTSKNSLIAFAEGRGKDGRTTCDDWSGTDLVFKRSLDNGLTWSSLGVFYTNSSSVTGEYNVVGNAAPVVDRTTGRIWVPFCVNNEIVFISYSDDDGVTWSPPVFMPHLTLPAWKWVGLGPPAGIQLSSGRMLIPAYHTTLIKGDGELSKGHTLYSDNGGKDWAIGAAEFGGAYLSNECQAVELKDGTVLINARTLINRRIQVESRDGGLTFGEPYVVEGLTEPLEGCEGSLVINPDKDTLYFSDPNNRSLIRQNMTVFASKDEGKSWQTIDTVDTGAVAYSAMQVHPDGALSLLYERSNVLQAVFDPDEIVYYRVL
jgi:sialidase-1